MNITTTQTVCGHPMRLGLALERVRRQLSVHTPAESSEFFRKTVLLMAAVEQVNTETKSRDIAATKNAMRTRGEFLGGKLNWELVRNGNKVFPNPDREALVEEMKALRAASVPLRVIKERMDELGHPISLRTIMRLTAFVATGWASRRGRRPKSWTPGPIKKLQKSVERLKARKVRKNG